MGDRIIATAPGDAGKTRWWGFYFQALLIFAGSRLVVAAGLLAGRLLPASKFQCNDPVWYERLLRWDSGWYAGIVRDGYHWSADPRVQNPAAFYPGYPLASFGVSEAFGMGVFPALVVVANIAAPLAVLLLARLYRDETDERTALLSLAFFCFFPYALFLSAGYAESLYLVFAALSMIFLTRARFLPASLMAGLATATRPTGIVLLPVILWQMARTDTRPWRRRLPAMAVCALLSVSGLLLYMAWLGHEFGHPLAFVDSQSAWTDGSLGARLVSGLTLASLQKMDGLDAGLFVAFLGLALWSFRRVRLPLALYGLGAVLLPYLTLGRVQSMGRFGLMCLPAFIVMATLTRGRPWASAAVLALSAGLLLLITALFSQCYWVV